jgi:hypothetical protein
MRLIDADLLIEKAKQDGAYDYVSAEEIANAPTIDAEPVKHGEWVNIFDNTWECTNCETCEQFAYNIESTSDYCPNCGAYMRGDTE